jgi:hypothetical protein
MNNITHELELAYKGNREYLHGTDIFTALLDVTGPVKKISIKFHKKVSKNLIAHFIDVGDLEDFRLLNNICVLMSYQKSGSTKIIAVIEGEKEITKRQEYCEDCITVDSEIYNQKITQKQENFGSAIERIVALNKRLLNHLHGKNQWFFTQIDMYEYCVNTKNISIEFERSIGGIMYKTILYNDGKKVGGVIFSKK